nr:hypothetical protein [Tanacetum cinerariifolium]
MESLNSNSQERELHQLQQLQDNAKESRMTSFRQLHSFLQVLSYDESKSRRVSERAFMTLFGQDNETFTSTMFLYLEIIFLEYTGIKVKQFRETLLLHMGNVKKSVAERTRHKRQYDRRMNERQIQSKESKVVLSKALDASLVVTECSGTKSDEHITNSSSGTYITHVVDADIRPVNDQEPSAEVHLIAQHNVLANEQQHTNQSEPSYDTYLLEKINELKAQLQAKNSTINNLKKEIKNVHEKSNEAKVKHDIDVIETINIELEHEVAKLLKENKTLKKHYKDLYVTPYYLPKVRESVVVKPNHVIASGSSRNSTKESYGSNDMAHNYYLKEAKKETQNKIINLKPSVMHTTSLQDTTNGRKPKPMSNNQTSRSLLVNCRAKVQSPKSRNNIKPAKRILNVKKVKDGSLKHIGLALHRQMTSADNTLGPAPQRKESSGLVPQPPSPTPNLPPTKNDWDMVFCPLFDEYLNPPPLVVSLVSAPVAASRAIDLAVHLRQLQLIKMYHLLVLHHQFKKFNLKSLIKVLKDKCMDIKIHNLIMHPSFIIFLQTRVLKKQLYKDPSSEETTLQGFIPSNLHHLNQSFDTLTKLTKNHPLENVIGDPS